MRVHWVIAIIVCVVGMIFGASLARAVPHQCEDDDGDCQACEDGDCNPGDADFCEDLHGAAFGLCNAFCNAQQCQIEWKHSCDELRRNFERQTGQSTFPCEGEQPTATGTRSTTRTPTQTPLIATATATATSGVGAATSTATRTPFAGATATLTAGTAAATVTATRTNSTATATGTATSTGPTATVTETPLTPATATRTATPAGAMGFCAELEGAAFGLCNAFCNAQACHLNPDQPSCDELRRNFERQTGSSVFPCEDMTPTGPTATATDTPSVPCMCDCDGDWKVSINDLTRLVTITLGSRPLAECPGMVEHGVVTIQDLVRGVRNALEGCG